MAKVNRYFPQVGIQDRPTGIPQSGRTPVADTIGQIADIGSQFARDYQKAQYASDATEAELEITKQINAYKENLRENPIQAPVGGDIVQAKEEDWNKFSSGLQKNYIDKIENNRLKEDLGTWWAGASEDGRAGVVEAAQDENIAFMGERQLDRINEFRTLGFQADNPEDRAELFGNADRAASAALDTGLISREEYNAQIESNNRTAVTAEALAQGSFSEARDFISVSDLSAEQKTIAKNNVNSLEQEQILRDKEQLTATQGQNLEEGFLGISTEDIFSIDQLNKMLEDGGVYEALDGPQGEQLRRRLERSISDRENPADADEIDEWASGRLDRLFRNTKSTRDDILNEMYELGGALSTKSYNYYYGLLDDAGYKRLNSPVNSYVDNQLDAMEKEGLFGEDEIGITQARYRIENFIHERLTDPGLTGREAATEQGFTMDDAVDLFYNERQKALGFDFKETETLRERRGDVVITDQERLLDLAQRGELFGQTAEAAIDRYIVDPSMKVGELRDIASRDIFNKNYDQLTKDEKNRIGLTEASGKIIRAAASLFRKEFLGVDGILGYEVDTGLPTIETQDNLYRLGFNRAENEEQWEVWDSGEWVPTGEIPDLHELTGWEKAAADIKDLYVEIRDREVPLYEEGLTRESAEIAAEQKRLREEELLLLDKEAGGVPLGRFFSKAIEWAFPGNK
ncbi:hypothetical protein KAR91_70005 [Candidatus Pacearchaeota archaeon]|nr:hypothetical protein [Candidatus Pacearchaeota archaeon]